jgi:hypothetical protein
LKARRTPTMWGHGIDNPKKHLHAPALIVWAPSVLCCFEKKKP